ncbi:MAG: macro domain-containing protein [Thermodesulfobacteriota bacterium]
MDRIRISATWDLAPGLLRLAQGDITAWTGDAVVNAANSSLAGGGGVDGAIHRAAGPDLLQAACREIVRRRGRLPAGRAVATPGFGLKARHIIHTVGPIYRDGLSGEPQALASAYGESLRLARELGAARVAFPAISCGAYGYPATEAARIALGELAQGLRQGLAAEAAMVLFSEEALQTWTAVARDLFGQPTE